MSNILIINSPLFREKRNENNEDSLPPLGLGYIATSLKILGHNVQLIDAVAESLSIPELIEFIKISKPDVVAANIFTTNYYIVEELIESIDDESIQIIIGGLSTRSLYKDIFKWNSKNNIDVVFGDGELITGDLISGKESENPFASSPSRRFFSVNCDSKYFVKDISEIPLDRTFFKNEPLKNVFGFNEVALVTTRGCKNNCAFCAAARSRIKDIPVREMSESSIIRNIENIGNLYQNVYYIRILDDLFLGSEKSVEKAVRIFKKFNFKWRAMAHVQTFNNISNNLLNSLKTSGCEELFIGIESGSPRILKKIHKPHEISMIKSSLEAVMDSGIGLKIYFIYGFPTEKKEDFEKTYNLAKELKIMATAKKVSLRTSVFQFRPYHGTELYDEILLLDKTLDAKKVHSDNKLSTSTKREQFNFTSGNYSDENDETIREFINKTLKLGEKD